jgi:predicted GH43/DUF377 family glycosyl hydrolase
VPNVPDSVKMWQDFRTPYSTSVISGTRASTRPSRQRPARSGRWSANPEREEVGWQPQRRPECAPVEPAQFKLGAGAPPLRIDEGWLDIYHGVDGDDRYYCLGALLLDADDPARVLGRSRDPIMEPSAQYERDGFYGNVVFATGAVADGDRLTIYYGAADDRICGATMSIREILVTLT